MAKKYYADRDVAGSMKKNGKRSGMISDDMSKPFNMPTDVVMRDFPALDYLDQDYDDTAYGMDEAANASVRKARAQKPMKRY